MVPALLASLAGLFSAWPDQAAWGRYAGRWGWAEAVGLLLLGLWMLKKRRSDAEAAGRAGAVEHLALNWYALIHGGSWLYSLAAHAVARHEGWTPAAAMLLPTLLCMGLLGRVEPPRWPLLDEHWLTLYRRGVLRPWALLLVLWVIVVNLFCDARMAPLSYLPLLNPLDLGHGLALLYALKLGRSTGASAPRWLLPGLIFWWLNSLLVRSLHHWGGSPLWTDGALSSGLVLTGLTLLWTLTALVLMSWATRRRGAGPGAAGLDDWRCAAGRGGGQALRGRPGQPLRPDAHPVLHGRGALDAGDRLCRATAAGRAGADAMRSAALALIALLLAGPGLAFRA